MTSTSAAATCSSVPPKTRLIPVLARELDATVCWFIDSPLRAGDRLALKQGTRTVRTTVQALHSRLDPETLDELDNPVELVLNDIGSVTLRTSSIVVADAYADNRDSGAFILIDETTNDTVGAGTIIEPREVKPGVQTRNDIRWHPSSLDRDYRWHRHRSARRHDLVHRASRIGKVDDRGGGGAGTGRIRAGRLSARR